MTTLTPRLQVFAFDSHAVRVVTRNGEPWFVAKDVAICLELAHHRDATRKLDEDEKGAEIIDTIGGAQQMSVVNESGLYAIILRCDGAMTPGHPAHTFRKWITAEVLPSLFQSERKVYCLVEGRYKVRPEGTVATNWRGAERIAAEAKARAEEQARRQQAGGVA